ncbi:hypothetical protein B0H65DRAFT_63941 [Neurospora tetraspora]|uniref:Uncharacterized protein n=1 Tax=Neurospora tetraspora TaxID=94610 RepID=A0AAE0JQQ0_9PEZI|nr:hypothetical protein B0H65DRAFT_63941 [Neurospora tetraspora]
MARLVRRLLLGRPSAQPDSVAQSSPALVNRPSWTRGAAQPKLVAVDCCEILGRAKPSLADCQGPATRVRVTSTGDNGGAIWENMGQYQRESGFHMVLESVLAAVVGMGGQPVQVDPAVAITHLSIRPSLSLIISRGPDRLR